MINQSDLLMHLTEMAYDPLWVYAIIILLLTASSFGLPIPEEVTLLSAGLLGYLSLNPDEYPPPYPEATSVNPWVLALICFFAVFLSDFLIFWLGRKGRGWISNHATLSKLLIKPQFLKVEDLVRHHGIWMAGAFRFTPGLRFPGHMACGMMGLSPLKFCLVDGFAALLTVPTQVLLVSYFGEVILASIKEFKLAVLCIVLIIATVWITKMIRSRKQITD